MDSIEAFLTAYRLSRIPGVILSALILFLVSRRPQWLGPYRWESLFIARAALVGSVFLLLIPERTNYFDHTALSFVLTLAGIALAYVYRDQPARAFKILCVSFIVIMWALFSDTMLRETRLLNFDERYYVSIAATASAGYGLYPALQNFPPMPAMGGIGHVTWLYVWAYQVLGPSLFSLRLVALLFSVLSLPPIFLLFRRWYGSVTGWLALALIPTTTLYIATFNARLDLFTITFLWWGLLLADIAREKERWSWYLATGLYFGLCLQAHIHTSIMTIAVGMLYVIEYVRQVRQTGRWTFPVSVIFYSIGGLIGLGVFIVANILPDPDAFFRSAGNTARFIVVKADLDTPMMDRLVKSLTSLDVFWTSFIARVRALFHRTQPVELILWIAAFVSLSRRRAHKATLPTIVLSVSVVIAGFFILNSFPLSYTTHIGPALLLCVPPFFTYGFSRRTSFEWADITPGLVLVLATCVFPIYMTTSLLYDLGSRSERLPQEFVTLVKTHIPTACTIIGPEELFTIDLPIYGLYYSGEPRSTDIGRYYFNYKTNPELWQTLDPDIAIVKNEVIDELQSWLIEMKYEEIFPSIWRKTLSPLSLGCVISD